MGANRNIIFARIRDLWMSFANAVGWVNTRLWLTIFYFVLLALPALILKMLRKDLLDRAFRTGKSNWHEKERSDHSLEEARRQF